MKHPKHQQYDHNPISSQYTYTYDALNRITGAVDNTTNYNVSGITYDQNGNVTKLLRKGHTNEGATTFGNMDNLTYGYDSGNKLLSVTDAVATPTLMKGEFKDGNKTGNDYNYDDNGNLIQDLNKGILAGGITYNHLNLPSSITTTSGNISYIYDASGTKLQKTVTEGSSVTSITDYAGNYIYENGDLQFFSHPEGYVNAEGSGYKYVYQYKDHLGNIRLSYQDADNNGSIATSEIVEEGNYYPFGLEHKGYNNVVNGTENNYKTFLGQEINKELGLNWLTFRYRNYMPEIGRFFGVDPVSEDYMSISTYQFAHNNPIWKIELEGLEGIPVNGFDQINHEPVAGNTNIGNSAIPIGDSTAGNYGSTFQTLSFDGPTMHASYPGESLDNLVTAGVQWLASELTGSDVSTETAGNIEMAANAIILVTSKGKNGKAASELTEQVSKKVTKTTAEKAANLAKAESKGIPKSQLGPSGKPKIHNSKQSTNKRAKDAARNNPRSNTKPVKHSSDKGQKTHYHSTRNGEKLKGKDNTHYTNEATKRNN